MRQERSWDFFPRESGLKFEGGQVAYPWLHLLYLVRNCSVQCQGSSSIAHCEEIGHLARHAALRFQFALKVLVYVTHTLANSIGICRRQVVHFHTSRVPGRRFSRSLEPEKRGGGSKNRRNQTRAAIIGWKK